MLNHYSLIVAVLIVTKHGHGLPISDFELIEANHPVPDENSVIAAKATFDFVKNVDQPLLVLISGEAQPYFVLLLRA